MRNYTEENFSMMIDNNFMYCCQLIDENKTNKLVRYLAHHEDLINGISFGTSLMHYSAAYGSDEIIKALYNLGASLDSYDAQGLTAFDVALLYARDEHLNNIATIYGLGINAANSEPRSYLEDVSHLHYQGYNDYLHYQNYNDHNELLCDYDYNGWESVSMTTEESVELYYYY